MAITFQDFDIVRTPGTTTSAPFSLTTGEKTAKYPTNSALIYGTDYAHSDYVIPIAAFRFYNANGTKNDNAPDIYMKLGGSFQTGLNNQFSPATNIYGSPGAGDAEGNEYGLGGVINVIKAAKEGFYTALAKQVVGGAAGLAGAFASVGQTGKQNVEFLQRRLFNQFQQLVYNGPNFRSFTLPFAMKATSYAEAKVVRNILASFRIASSPIVSKDEPGALGDADVLGSMGDTTGADADTKAKLLADAKAGEINQGVYDALVSASNSAKTFGYPDMCRFQILLYQNGVGSTPVLFESDLCVIENVNIDYGGQQKMTFFKPEDGVGGQYFPTDITLNIGLKETSLVTSAYATNEALKTNRTIL
jgi:hypothetical protein